MSNETRALALSTIAWLEARAIPATSEHYRVAFAHRAGEDPAASATLAEREEHRGSPEVVQPECFRGRFFDRAPASAPVEHGRRREQLASGPQRKRAEAGEEARRCGGTSDPVRALVAPPRGLALVGELLGRITDGTGRMQERAERHRGGLASGAAAIGEPRRSSRAARQAASADAPIGPAERPRFAPALAELTAEAAAERPATSITADIDRVEASDGRSGRRTGDRVSKLVAELSRDFFEGRDPVDRPGGEGFALVLADTPLATGGERADRLGVRRVLRHLPTRDAASAGRITPRLAPDELQPGEPIAQRADRALSAAERAGHDRATGLAPSVP
ncbi:MAG: GGDEF domain-containing protein [Geminicoccaceae bacterium]|nr:GGDEF domain-containing protein [Geminicoccaceae bacterium]